MKKTIYVIFGLLTLFISGCSDANSCEGAKTEVLKYYKQYMKSIYEGKLGASVPGGAESLAALAIAQKNCGKPDLTIEDVLKEKNFTAQDVFK
jgi:hypothetical protein